MLNCGCKMPGAGPEPHSPVPLHRGGLFPNAVEWLKKQVDMLFRVKQDALVEGDGVHIDEHNRVSVVNKADLVDGRVPASQLPSYVDDVLEFDTQGSFPEPGETGKIYVAKDTNRTYRWSGSQYVGIGGGVQSVNGETDDITIDISGGTVFDKYDPPPYVSGGQTKVDVGTLRISKGAASLVTNGEPEPALIGEVKLTGVFTTPTGASIKENPGSEKTLSQAVAENYATANGADAKINAHMANTGNPHSTTAAQVGAYTKHEVDEAIASNVQYSLNADNIKDRAVNNIGLSDAGPYALTPPQQVPGSVRDFVVRIKTGSVAPTIDWSAFGSCEVRDGDSWEDMMVCEANKDYIYRFTDMGGLTLFAAREEVA